jgi:hypothetical protein
MARRKQRHGVGVGELSVMFAVSRQAAHAWTNQKGFPDLDEDYFMGPSWRVKDVEKWAQQTGREVVVPSTKLNEMIAEVRRAKAEKAKRAKAAA